jgi:hypothetical protein
MRHERVRHGRESVPGLESSLITADFSSPRPMTPEPVAAKSFRGATMAIKSQQ